MYILLNTTIILNNSKKKTNWNYWILGSYIYEYLISKEQATRDNFENTTATKERIIPDFIFRISGRLPEQSSTSVTRPADFDVSANQKSKQYQRRSSSDVGSGRSTFSKSKKNAPAIRERTREDSASDLNKNATIRREDRRICSGYVGSFEVWILHDTMAAEASWQRAAIGNWASTGIFEWPSRYSWRPIVASILWERNKHLRESVGEMWEFFPNITADDISLCRTKGTRGGTVRREGIWSAFQEEVETSS